MLEDYVDFASVEIANPGEKSWIAYEKNEYSLIRKIIEQGKPLKEWDIQINRGILTGFNEAFIINDATKELLIAEDPKCDEIIRPILRGEDIKAYLPQWSGLWLINTHNGIKSERIPRVDVVNDYPSVYKWFITHQKALEKRYDKGDHWTNLRNCAYIGEFDKPKIIYPNMTKFMPFVYDKHQFFTNDKSFIITGSHLGYLTAFLNSKLFKFAFKDDFPELLGETRELRKVFFENISVKSATDDEWFIEKIENIVANKKNGLETKYLENEIDERIFELYELTNSEKAILSGNSFPLGFSEESINRISASESV